MIKVDVVSKKLTHYKYWSVYKVVRTEVFDNREDADKFISTVDRNKYNIEIR